MSSPSADREAVGSVEPAGGLQGWPALVLRFAPPAALAGAWLFAVRALLPWDPGSELRVVAEGVSGWFFASTAGAPQLVYLGAAWLLWRRRARLLASASERPAPWGAIGLFFVAGAMALWSHRVGLVPLLLPAGSLCLLAAGLAIGGRRGAAAVVYPACFLLFAAPMPATFVNQVVYPLQLATGVAVTAVLEFFSIPATRFGDLIFASDHVFQVIETCSGLRAVETLCMTAFVYGEVFHRNPARVAMLVVVAPFVALAFNVLRVLSIVLNPLSTFAAIHTIQGMVMLFAGVLALGAIDWGLGRFFARPVPRDPPLPAGRGPILPWSRVAVPLLVMLIIGAGPWLIPQWEKGRRTQPPTSALLAYVSGLRSSGAKIDEAFLGSVGFTTRIHRRYKFEEREVELFVGENDRTDSRMSLLSDKTAIPGSGWEVVAQREVDLGPEGPVAILTELRSRRQQAVSLHWRAGLASPLEETVRAWLGLDRSSFRREERASVVRIVALARRHHAGIEEAENLVLAFFERVRPALTRLEVIDPADAPASAARTEPSVGADPREAS